MWAMVVKVTAVLFIPTKSKLTSTIDTSVWKDVFAAFNAQ